MYGCRFYGEINLSPCADMVGTTGKLDRKLYIWMVACPVPYRASAKQIFRAVTLGYSFVLSAMMSIFLVTDGSSWWHVSPSDKVL